MLALILVLELVSRSGLVDSRFLPPFTAVLGEAVLLWTDPQFRTDVGATLLTYVLGMLIASAIAIPLGTLFGLSNGVYRAARALIELIRPIPPVALVPLVLLVLGAGLEMKLVIVVFAAVWPIMFNTLYGVHDVDPYAKDMARSFGVGRFGIVRRIIIPSATPFVVTGIRIASSIALIVVITVELIAGGAQGIGAFISRERAYGDADSYLAVLAATITAGILGLAINMVIGWAERRFFGWDATTRGESA
ncbi:nitrate ABC transporter permease [Agromyces rhizosphaerae]|uniref:Nitrate ABC transporter permease n=1 Tax=Agromyces rhizosphaerae TaxID=88374 RepID=A0A9W6FQX4_9MICO|nr:nitrate ABC transporter permease [Agromyces rhizosphaerae]